MIQTAARCGPAWPLGKRRSSRLSLPYPHLSRLASPGVGLPPCPASDSFRPPVSGEW